MGKVLPILRPTEWLSPERYSYSTLVRLRECPRRWQLQHARYGESVGYPEPFQGSAERGRLVHQLVSHLFRAMAKNGNPPVGSPNFQAAIRELDPLGTASRLVEQFRERWARDPRPSKQRFSWTPLEIYSAASLTFHREYRPMSGKARPPAPPAQPLNGTASGRAASIRLSRTGVLSEHRVEHPTLPIFGYVDLILQGQRGAILVDIKTGSPSPSHKEQVALYALLWWRQEGQLPESGELRYGTHAEPVDVRPESLELLETDLAREIQSWSERLSAEANATPGEHCQRCPVRPSCDPYWEQPPQAGEWVDAEIVVEGADALGLRVRQRSGAPARLLLPPDRRSCGKNSRKALACVALGYDGVGRIP